MLKANGAIWPGRTSASARMRAMTSMPPSRVTAKVSEPAGSTTSTRQSLLTVASLPRSAPAGSVIASGRRPRMTDLPAKPVSARAAGPSGSRSDWVPLTARRSAAPFELLSSGAVIMFIEGEPMKPATKVLAGRL
jgi:hypothetical protein